MPTLGSRINKSRKAAKLTQQQVAKHLNVVRTSVSHWESDLREPDLKTIKALAKLFNVSFEYLVGAKEETTVSERNHLSNIQTSLEKEFGKDVSIMFKDISNWDESKIKKLRTFYEMIKDEKI